VPQITKFDGQLVNPDLAGETITPAYDAMSPRERREFAEAHPDNYVNVMRSLEEYDGDGPTLDEILQHNKLSHQKLYKNHAFIQNEMPAYYLYQLRSGNHQQTGVIANIPLDDYTSGRLKKHEDTQSEKERMLACYHQVVGVTSSPICVAYPDRPAIDELITQAKQGSYYLQLQVWDDVEQTVWRVDDTEIATALESEFSQIDYTYLTDGHHRCASTALHAQWGQQGEVNPDRFLADSSRLLVALFPESQLQVYSYFRCVRDLGDLSVAELIKSIESIGIKIRAMKLQHDDDLLPKEARNITMIVDDQVFQLQIPEFMVPADDPVGSLDVSILQTRILSPILGIHDARSDSRLSYTPGVEGISGLVARCQQGWRLGFACIDTTMQEIIAVADANRVMPPKSTWFDPKLRAGIFLRHC